MKRTWENPGTKKELVDLSHIAYDLLGYLDCCLERGDSLAHFAGGLNVRWLREHEALYRSNYTRKDGRQ